MKRNQEVYDVDMKAPATAEQLSRILNKAREQKKLENDIEKAEQHVKDLKRKLALINTKELVELMNDAGETTCPLGQGWQVDLNSFVTASIPSPDSKTENAEEKNKIGVAYMRKAAPSLLKNQIVINFGIEEEQFFKKFMRDLAQRKREVDFSVKTTVHAKTLEKWVKDQDKLGKSVDEIALNVHRFKKTVLVGPKKKKADEI